MHSVPMSRCNLYHEERALCQPVPLGWPCSMQHEEIVVTLSRTKADPADNLIVSLCFVGMWRAGWTKSSLSLRFLDSLEQAVNPYGDCRDPVETLLGNWDRCEAPGSCMKSNGQPGCCMLYNVYVDP